MTVDAENDKNGVIALREIAEKTIDPGDVREGFIHALQSQAEIDEPEVAPAPTLPRVDRPALGRDDPSTDTVVDAVTEDELLRRMQNLMPMDAHARSGGGFEGQ
jgi:DNA-directed RNA polymerase subunit omega